METSDQTVLARFCNTDGEPIGPQLSLPFDISTEQLSTLLNQHILKNVRISNLDFRLLEGFRDPPRLCQPSNFLSNIS
jgi:hypothetical protein